MKDRKAGRVSHVVGQITEGGAKMIMDWEDLKRGQVVSKGKNVLVRVQVKF